MDNISCNQILASLEVQTPVFCIKVHCLCYQSPSDFLALYTSSSYVVFSSPFMAKVHWIGLMRTCHVARTKNVPFPEVWLQRDHVNVHMANMHW